MSNKIQTIILNGFLGSGKTTLFRDLLVQSEEQNIAVCAVVNDMSELDVDGEVIGNIEFIEENNHIFKSIHSCVLSSDKGIEKLDKAITELIDNQFPELIIIETSGSCHPMPLIEYFKKQSQIQLTGVFTLVDSLMLAHDYNYGEQLIPLFQKNLQLQKRDMNNLLVEQILFCSHLILTKTDRIPQDKIQPVAKSLQQINPLVNIISVLHGKYPIDEILDLPEYNYHRVAQLTDELKPVLKSETKNDRPYNMATRVIKDDRPFHPERLWEVCHKYLDQRIYRSKGFFWLASRDQISLLWNQAAGSINLELIGYWRSGIVEENPNGLSDFEIEKLQEMLEEDTGEFGDRHCNLTVIGDETQVDKFTEALKACFLTDEEILHWEMGGDFSDPWPKNIVKMVKG